MTKKAAFGLAAEAIGANFGAARLAGIRAARNIWLIYIFCGRPSAEADEYGGQGFTTLSPAFDGKI